MLRVMKSLYFWIICAFLGGILLGIVSPALAIKMEPLGLSFIKLIKLFIGPIVFLTIATGIAQTGSLTKLGRIGLKAIIYFEIVSTIALLLGWIVAVLFKPGENIHATLQQLDAQPATAFIASAENLSIVSFLQSIIPSNIVEPFMKGDMLQILFLAILFGVGLVLVDEKYSAPLTQALQRLTQVLFKVIQMIMYAAPIGVFGAMAYTVGKFGGHLLIPLLGLVGTFYFTGFMFIFIVLNLIAYLVGFSLLHFLRYLLPEILLVLGTSSSESALPQLLRKLEIIGCEPETVGVVVPLGYSFNLDGTNIYITLSALFIAQALGIDLTITQQITIFVVAMLSSKGAAGITGAGFITLAATLSVVSVIPPIGIMLVLGIDRFMSEVRALVNFIGNGVAALVISRWENEVSGKSLNQAMKMNKNLI